MASYKYGKYLHQNDGSAFDAEKKPGEEVKHSGIYTCVNCGREVACNAGDPFPPQNDHQHPGDEPIRWKLIVAAAKK